MHDEADEEKSTSPLQTKIPTPRSYHERFDETQLEPSTGGVSFAYDDEYSEVHIPATPSVRMSHYAHLEDDSVQDKASVTSSFMDYTYSNDFDESTVGTLVRAHNPVDVEASLDLDVVSLGVDTTKAADIQSTHDGPVLVDYTGIMKSSNEMEDRKCIPAWVSNASSSLKFVIVVATALLMASLALVSISASVSSNDGSGNADNNGSLANLEITNAPTPSLNFITFTASPAAASVTSGPIASTVISEPTASPINVASVNPTASVSSEPSVTESTSPTSVASSGPTVSSSSSPSSTPSSSPTVTHSFAPSQYPTAPPSPHPSATPTQTLSSPPTVSANEAAFFAVAKNRQIENIATKLGDLPSEQGEWLIHLGNWNNQNPEKCNEYAYNKTATEYSHSSVPVFFMPGKNEWNGCPDFHASQAMWRDHFVGYEAKHWNPLPFAVHRQDGREENFAFTHKNTVYVGLNMVTGVASDAQEWGNRLEDNIQWVDENVILDKNWDAELVVIFGNSGMSEANLPFFSGLQSKIETWTELNPDLHVLYVKQGSARMNFSKNIMGLSNFFMLNVENDRWPPTRIALDTNRYTMSFDDEEWYNDTLV